MSQYQNKPKSKERIVTIEYCIFRYSFSLFLEKIVIYKTKVKTDYSGKEYLNYTILCISTMLEIQGKPYKCWLISHAIRELPLVKYGTLFEGYVDTRISPYNPWVAEKLYGTHIYSFLRKTKLNNHISIPL